MHRHRRVVVALGALPGWIYRKRIECIRVDADDRQQDLPRLALAPVARQSELTNAPPQIATMAAWQATRRIPISFATGTDPVGAGLAASLAHPGDPVTSIVNSVDSLAPRRLELLRAILHHARRIGLAANPHDPRMNTERSAAESAAAAPGLKFSIAEASNPVELDAAGAFFSDGAPLDNQLRRSAQMVDQLLSGAHTADMAIEQPTRFALVINLRAEKALGITIPQSMLPREEKAIQ